MNLKGVIAQKEHAIVRKSKNGTKQHEIAKKISHNTVTNYGYYDYFELLCNIMGYFVQFLSYYTY